jgi:4'-phosphopantetheinyl transferase
MRARLLRGLRSRVTLSRLKNNNLDMPSATLWLLDGSRVPEEDLAFFVQQLGASEARRYGCFKRRERKRQFLLGRMLLRFAVSSLMSLPPDVLGLVERTGTAPQLVLPDSESLLPSFSLSHSRDWVACVVGPNVTLGVDIEVNDPTRDVLGISELVFHPDEHCWLLPQIDSARLSAFYHLWCTREALYKLRSSLGRQRVLSPLVGVDGVFASQGPNWHRYTLPHSALTVAICSDQPLSSLYKIEPTELTRVDWLAAVSSMDTVTASMIERVNDRCSIEL